MGGKESVIIGAIIGFVSGLLLFVWQRGDDNDLATNELYGDDRLWVVDHPILTGLIVFAAIAIVIRLFIFMKRVESR